MLTIIHNHQDPKFNLALEEYVLKFIETDEDILLLYQNVPSIIVGRNQNVFEEINHQFVKKHNIPVIRRISGGGTVYHDLGNLNFSFITNDVKGSLSNYKKFTLPIINALNDIGVKASFFGKSDIILDGKKISGNAQSFYKKRMLHHGTLLFDTNLLYLNEAIQSNVTSIESKSIKSNRSFVTNIKDYLDKTWNIQDFKTYLYRKLFGHENYLERNISLTQNDYDEIEKLIHTRYDLWSWNYGESPEFQMSRTFQNDEGISKIDLQIHQGKIADVKVYNQKGDYVISDIQKLIMHTPMDESIIIDKLKSSPYQSYIPLFESFFK